MTTTQQQPGATTMKNAAFISRNGVKMYQATRKQPFSSWKREVWDIVRGLPMVRAVEKIKQIADDSLQAGEITRRSHERALEWADRIYWRIRPDGANYVD